MYRSEVELVVLTERQCLVYWSEVELVVLTERECLVYRSEVELEVLWYTAGAYVGPGSQVKC